MTTILVLYYLYQLMKYLKTESNANDYYQMLLNSLIGFHILSAEKFKGFQQIFYEPVTSMHNYN